MNSVTYVGIDVAKRTLDVALGPDGPSRTLAYDADLDAKYVALTADEILAALNKHIDPDRIVIVTAGDFAKAGAGGK